MRRRTLLVSWEKFGRIESMDELDLGVIKRRSVVGVLALTSRTAFLQAVSFAGTFLLTIFLDPQIFGVFFVVSAIISFLTYFSDIGLAAALIQKPKITKEDLDTTFTIQQGLVLTILIAAFIVSEKLAAFYNLHEAGLWLLRALLFSFFLSSLKTIPSIILERKLDFHRLVVPQITETLVFYGMAVSLAWKGFGVWSFTWAVLARGIVGLIAMYVLAPWVPSLRVSNQSAKPLLSFGVPFQTNSLLALVKDDLLTIVLGKILPLYQVGLIGWAKKWAETPLRLLMDSVVRVTFPAYSRLQNKPEELGRALEKAIFFLSILIFPLTIGLVFLLKPLIFIIPKYLKWEPALTSFYLFALASAIAAISTPLTNALNAVGKVKITLKLMIMWTVLVWVLTPFLVLKMGFNGVALAQALIGVTVLVVIWVVKRHIDFAVVKNIFPAILSSLMMAVFLYSLVPVFSQTLVGLFVLTVFGGIIYLTTLWLVTLGRVWQEVKIVLAILKKE